LTNPDSIDFYIEQARRLARNDAFVALLRRIGGPRSRQALRAHLLSSPLGTDAAPETELAVDTTVVSQGTDRA
jgi:hypothetical protein